MSEISITAITVNPTSARDWMLSCLHECLVRALDMYQNQVHDSCSGFRTARVPLRMRFSSEFEMNARVNGPDAPGDPLKPFLEILKALLDAIRTLEPYYRAVLLMGFLLLLAFALLIRDHANQAYLALLGMIIIFVIALLKKPPPRDAVLASEQDTRAKMILPNALTPS